MWKLLSKRDRRQIRKAEADSDKDSLPLVVPTTAGIREYSCVNCQRYSHDAGSDSCAAKGIPPDTMPCALSPHHPERNFVPLPETAARPLRLLGALDLPQMLILNALLDRQIELLLAKDALNLPYRPGDLVTFVHDQTLQTAEVLDFDRDQVTVRLAGAELSLPHATVIPPRRNGQTKTETRTDPDRSDQDLKQNSNLPGTPESV
jgi:hypothetical protein